MTENKLGISLESLAQVVENALGKIKGAQCLICYGHGVVFQANGDDYTVEICECQK